MNYTYRTGDHVLLVDKKRRRYLIVLEPGEEFHSHNGVVAHDDLIGTTEGKTILSSRGGSFVSFRPSLAEYILKMPRGAQVIYPKDLASILMFADVFPGARILETGVGSGALSMALLRAGASVVGYEIREDFAKRASANVEAMLGGEVIDRYQVLIRDAYKGIDNDDFDRILLDLPEPWRVTPHAAGSLKPGGIMLAYTPSIVQVSKFHKGLAENGFGLVETTEVIHRNWHVEGEAIRPNHRMVAHTGFLTYARLLVA